MTLYTDLSLDIETLGTEPGSMIRTIAVVAFNSHELELGPDFAVRLLLDPQKQAGLVISPDTFLWWLQQDESARVEMYSHSELPDMAPREALTQIGAFVANNCVERVRVWAKSPSFDCVLLADLARRFRVALPWSYNRERDVRTIIDITGVEINNFSDQHTSLADASAQARAIQYACARLRSAGVSSDPKDYVMKFTEE